MNKTQVERTRRYRARHFLKYKYWNKKTNAKKRGLSFNLTFEQFTNLYREGFVIDRIDPLRGYEPDNVRAVSVRVNCVKGATADKYRHAMAKEATEFLYPDGVPF